jgi:hypothetical protein
MPWLEVSSAWSKADVVVVAGTVVETPWLEAASAWSVADVVVAGTVVDRRWLAPSSTTDEVVAGTVVDRPWLAPLSTADEVVAGAVVDTLWLAPSSTADGAVAGTVVDTLWLAPSSTAAPLSILSAASLPVSESTSSEVDISFLSTLSSQTPSVLQDLTLVIFIAPTSGATAAIDEAMLASNCVTSIEASAFPTAAASNDGGSVCTTA